jgi:hypothetical protein
MRILDALSAAADLLAQDNAWIQGEFQNVRGERRCFCIAGALAHVADIGIDYDSLEPYAAAMGFPSPGDMIDFNDEPGRTQDEVVARLRAPRSAP